MARLSGKVALVTGGAQGIGQATVEAFVREGALVVAGDIAPDQSVASDRLMPLRHDVTQEESWIETISIIERKFGKLNILVNNAGGGSLKPLVQTSLEEWRSMFAVNLDGTFLGIKHAIPAMTRAGGGTIVNLSSIRGVTGVANAGSYCAAKAGVALLTKVAALECAEAKINIRVNSVHPGFVLTPLNARVHTPAFRAKSMAETPLGRFAQPSEIADAILYLASDESSFVTGSGLMVDGGFTAQ
jgi:NAD(P)-dependent dehydrogenase (short-subunit alcohol dehydrogenase family)